MTETVGLQTRISVLGPVELREADRPAEPLTHKSLHLLALLAAHANQPVRFDDCVSELWPTAPPKTAVSTVQTYVLALRGTLRLGDVTLMSRSKSYLLATPDPAEVIDQFDFERHVRNALTTTGRPQREATRSALRVWKGVAFANLRTGPVLAPVATRLDEQRRAVLAIAYAQTLRAQEPPQDAELQDLVTAGIGYVLDERLFSAFRICAALRPDRPRWTDLAVQWRERVEGELYGNLGVGLGRTTLLVERHVQAGEIDSARRTWLAHYD